MDTIGDFLTIIRNASLARNKTCTCPSSRIRMGIAQILKNEGYIHAFEEFQNEKGFRQLNITLKYHKGEPVIREIKRVSKPGCRLYFPYNKVVRVLGGLGISILTTPEGLKTDKEARRQKIGGELICQVC